MKLDKKEPGVPGIVNLPDPAPGRGGRKVVVLALLAVLLVGGAAYWLTRDKETRDHWRDQAAAVIDNATSGTPLAGVGDVLRDAPPPPPPSVVSPYTAPGTLAGQNVQGTVNSPADAAMPGNGTAAGPDGFAPPTGLTPRVTEDSRVRPQFVENLAAYLVSRFKPGPRVGTLNASVQSVNQRFGSKLTGLGDGDAGGRVALLRYAFHPTMLQGLYSLYVDRFMEDIAREAKVRDLNAEQTQQLYMALAGRFVMLAGALEGVAATPDLDARLRQMDAAAQNTVGINRQLAEATFEYDQLREAKASQAQLNTAQLRVDGLGARFRRSLEEQAVAQRALVNAVRRGAGQTMDDDELIFVARWADRRLKQDPQAMASVQTSAGILRDHSRRCAQAATGAPVQRNGSSASHNGSPAPHNGAPAPYPGAAQQPVYSGSMTGQGAAPGAAQGLTPPAGNGALSAPASTSTQIPASAPAQIPASAPAQVPSQGMAPAVPAAPTAPHASPALTLPAARPEAVGSPVQAGGQER